MSKCARERGRERGRGRGRETWLSHALPLRSLRMMHGSICLSLSQIYLPSHLTASADDMTLDAANAMSGHYKGYPKDWRKATLTKAFTAEESAAHAAAGQYSPHHEGMRACPHATALNYSLGGRESSSLLPLCSHANPTPMPTPMPTPRRTPEHAFQRTFSSNVLGAPFATYALLRLVVTTSFICDLYVLTASHLLGHPHKDVKPHVHSASCNH